MKYYCPDCSTQLKRLCDELAYCPKCEKQDQFRIVNKDIEVEN